MTRKQFAFLIGVVLVWVAWDAGWLIFAAVAAGLIAVGVVQILEGDLDLGDFTDRFRSSNDSPKR